MDITTLTTEQLESLAYKEIVKMEQAKNNLAILQNEMQKRSQVPATEEIEPLKEGE